MRSLFNENIQAYEGAPFATRAAALSEVADFLAEIEDDITDVVGLNIWQGPDSLWYAQLYVS